MPSTYMSIEDAISFFRGCKVPEPTCPKCGETGGEWFGNETTICPKCSNVSPDEDFENTKIINGIDYSGWQVGDRFEVNEYTLREGIVCWKCKKRAATVGIFGLNNGKPSHTSWCDSCYNSQSYKKYAKKY